MYRLPTRFVKDDRPNQNEQSKGPAHRLGAGTKVDGPPCYRLYSDNRRYPVTHPTSYGPLRLQLVLVLQCQACVYVYINVLVAAIK